MGPHNTTEQPTAEASASSSGSSSPESPKETFDTAITDFDKYVEDMERRVKDIPSEFRGQDSFLGLTSASGLLKAVVDGQTDTDDIKSLEGVVKGELDHQDNWAFIVADCSKLLQISADKAAINMWRDELKQRTHPGSPEFELTAGAWTCALLAGLALM